MKRKRGPAPKEKHRKVKRREEEEVGDGSMDEDALLDNESEEFGGFSSHDEEIEDSAIATNEGPGPSQPSQSGTQKKRGKKAAATPEELLDLYYRSSSFQSNLFKLQVDELLSEVRVKYDKMEKIENILHKLRDLLLKLPSREEQLVNLIRKHANC